MATVATRAPKRDLAPDWRDALREAVRRFALRSWGVMLIGLGLAAAHGVGAAIGLIRNPQVEGPVRFATLLLFTFAGLGVGYFALGLTEDERGWVAGLFRRAPRERRAELRRTEIVEDRAIPAAPPRSKPTVAVTEPARTAAPGARGAGRKPSSAQPGLALGDSYQLPTV